MNHTTQLPPEGPLLVDGTGRCRLQQLSDNERTLCHVARHRVNRIELTATICAIINWKESQYWAFLEGCLRIWLKEQLFGTVKEDMPDRYFDEDVKEIIRRDGVLNWWTNAWFIREEWVLPALVRHQQDHALVLKKSLDSALVPSRVIRQATAELCRINYSDLHTESMMKVHSQMLNNSYANNF